ncbi:hypothetical protein FDJ70_00090 [Clostridium botulinum]|uniref:Uncharacterized protein n=1 Tax=Clostridium botulinum D str. 1873 TaxID=592027 RepID=A0A9P2G6F5_CLOBO|nr:MULTISPECIES: hypothetical protein [Clostridium]EES90808.1 hypothetical protein CLG_B0752 [Clostridium botulinum D str. 1873]MBO3442340.1 hypothetical protein [Clostridium haemolyticum]NFV46087.1 hypothetical protein [Clostridium botulinum]QPW54851.1 hypothetical protein IRP61_06180 [Clostridium botulinum]
MFICENQFINKYTNAPSNFITMTNAGAYVAFFTIEFYVGYQFYIHKSPKLPYGKSFKIIYGSNPRQIRITAYCYTGLGNTKIICRKTSYDAITACFSLGGTVFNPTCTEIPCPPNNCIFPKIPLQTSCCCCCYPKMNK